MKSSADKTMQAYLVHKPGGPERLEPTELPIPSCAPGTVLIRIRAFGLNRSEWFTRRGDSPGVRFPRVLGIECVGEIADPGDTDFRAGQTVAAMMGGMGRDFDGSYAEFTVVPRNSVFALDTDLPWHHLGALPEMLQTTHGSLYTALEIERSTNLLVRGGTSSIGFAAIAIGRAAGLTVSATTRSAAKKDALIAGGAEHVLIDNGSIVEQAQRLYPAGFDRVLELIGTTTLRDSLRATRRGGIVCMTGILGGEWVLPEFHPMGDIPTAVALTSYSGNASDITESQLQRYVELVENGDLALQAGPVFSFDKLRDAHDLMDRNAANGKIVVVMD